MAEKKSTKPTNSTPITLSDIRAAKTAQIVEVPIYLDGETIGRIEALNAELGEAMRRERLNPQGMDSRAGKIRTEILALTDKAEASKRVFRFRSIGGKFRQLLLAHRPTAEQQEAAAENSPGARLEFNPETFPPALIAASCISPVITEPEAMDLWVDDSWSEGDLIALFDGAMLAQQRRSDIPFSRLVSAVTPSSQSEPATQ